MFIFSSWKDTKYSKQFLSCNFQGFIWEQSISQRRKYNFSILCIYFTHLLIYIRKLRVDIEKRTFLIRNHTNIKNSDRCNFQLVKNIITWTHKRYNKQLRITSTTAANCNHQLSIIITIVKTISCHWNTAKKHRYNENEFRIINSSLNTYTYCPNARNADYSLN